MCVCKKKEETVQRECQEREIIQEEVKEKVTIRKACASYFFLRFPLESIRFSIILRCKVSSTQMEEFL